jgi:hypothetical protein
MSLGRALSAIDLRPTAAKDIEFVVATEHAMPSQSVMIPIRPSDRDAVFAESSGQDTFIGVVYLGA